MFSQTDSKGIQLETRDWHGKQLTVFDRKIKLPSATVMWHQKWYTQCPREQPQKLCTRTN